MAKKFKTFISLCQFWFLKKLKSEKSFKSHGDIQIECTAQLIINIELKYKSIIETNKQTKKN